MTSVQQMTAGQQQMAASARTVAGSPATPGVTAAATATGGTITANDFLTLLVTEMKNQDPTQPTDPNAYIQQLVQVNSLQQLIGINQGITSLDTPSSGATSGTTPVTGA